MKKYLILCLILAIMTGAMACGSKKADETVPFNLSEDWMMQPTNESILIQSREELENFLADETVFSKEPSKEFTKINEKYDEKYFEKNDLIALMIWASSGSYYGYHIRKPVELDHVWIIETEALTHGNSVTHDMGGVFCYYVEVPKKTGIIGASLVTTVDSAELGQKHQLTVVNEYATADGLPKSGSFNAGHTFRFYVNHVTDGSYFVYLNDEKIMPKATGSLHDKGDYYVIVMPDSDGKLVITNEVFYLDKEYSVEDVYWWVKNITRKELTEVTVSERIFSLQGNEASTTATTVDEAELDDYYAFLKLNTLKKSELKIADVQGGTAIQVSYVVNGIHYTLDKIEMDGKEYIHWYDFSSSQLFEIEKGKPDVTPGVENRLTVIHMEGPGPDVGLLAALENFYQDDEYIYSFPYIMSGAISCKLSDGSVMTFAEAFKKGIATRSDLDAFGFKYYKTKKDIEIADK